LIPALRDRQEELPGLIANELKVSALRMGKKITAIHPAAMDRSWLDDQGLRLTARGPLPLDEPFTPWQAHELGVSRETLRHLVRSGLVRPQLRGVYVAMLLLRSRRRQTLRRPLLLLLGALAPAEPAHVALHVGFHAPMMNRAPHVVSCPPTSGFAFARANRW